MGKKWKNLLDTKWKNMTGDVLALLVNWPNSDEGIENLNDVHLILESVHNINETFNSDSGVFKNTIEVNEADVLKMWVSINFLDDFNKSSDDIRSNCFTGSCWIVEDESLLFRVRCEHPSAKLLRSSLFDSHFCVGKNKICEQIKMMIDTYTRLFGFVHWYRSSLNLWFRFWRLQVFHNKWSSCNTWQYSPCSWNCLVLLQHRHYLMERLNETFFNCVNLIYFHDLAWLKISNFSTY